MNIPRSTEDPNYLMWVSGRHYSLADLIAGRPQPHLSVTSIYYDAPAGKVMVGTDPKGRRLPGQSVIGSLVDMDTYRGYVMRDTASNASRVAGAIGYAFLDIWEKSQRDNFSVNLVEGVHEALMQINQRLCDAFRRPSVEWLPRHRRSSGVLLGLSVALANIDITGSSRPTS